MICSRNAGNVLRDEDQMLIDFKLGMDIFSDTRLSTLDRVKSISRTSRRGIPCKAASRSMPLGA